MIRVDGEIISLARYFWEAYFKRPAVGRLVRYRCRMKLCVRPTHYRESIRIPAAIARNQTALDLYLAPLRQS